MAGGVWGRGALAGVASLLTLPVAYVMANIGYALGENDDEVWSLGYAVTFPPFWVFALVVAAFVAGLALTWVRVWRPDRVSLLVPVLVLTVGGWVSGLVLVFGLLLGSGL